MPSVDELLNMAEVAEVTLTETNDKIEIDADTRTMTIPDTERIFGVMSDEKGERKYFRCKRFVGNGIDLSKLSLRIVFQNASGFETGRDKYIVTDLATDGEDYVTFSWELSRKVTAYKGIISFIVCAIKTNTDGTVTNEWNTTLANGIVLEGLEANGTQEQEEVAKDYYNQLEAELLRVANEQKTEIEKKAQEVIGTIPSDYTQTLKDVSNLKGEVIDGRTDVDGEEHKNIGDSIRGQARKLRENLVVRQKEQPTDPNNNVWISDEDDEVEVPDMGEFNSLKEDLVGQAISTQTVPTISWEMSKYVNGTTGEIGSAPNIDLATIDVSMFAKIKGMAYFANDAGYAFFDKNGAYLTGENNTVVATYNFPLDVDIPKESTVMCISHRTGKGFELNVTGQIKYIGELLSEQDAKVSEKIEKIEQKISSPQNMRDIVTKDVLENTDSINISVPNTKSGNIISFYANIANMYTLKIGHGTAAYASSNVRIKNNTVEIHRQDSSDVLVNTYTHNLIFNKFIDVLIETHLNNTADVTISSENGSYHIKNVEWLGSSGNIFATAVSGKYTHCELSYYCKDISKPVWFFGDSYMSQWNVYAYEYGAKNWLNDSYSGRNSSEAQAVASIKKDIAKGIPKVIVWALGMNDQEKYSWGLIQWKNGYEVVKDICKKNNIELILVTIPNTPTMKNTEKNKIIKESGYRYVDIAALVGGESENSTWYEGMLSEDNVHASEIGRKAIALKMMTDVPEMI